MTTPARLGVVVGKFLPPHRGHSHLIETACGSAQAVTVIVCDRPDDPIPAEARAAMLRVMHPEVTVVVTPDDIPDGEGDATSRAWARRTEEICGGSPPDVVFTSESYGDRYAHFLGARHVCVDPGRVRFPVSGTLVRADPFAQKEFLHPAVRAWFVRRVCVVGAESTGTTTLAQDLAAHYGCEWVPEYGRRYSEERLAESPAIDWNSDDFLHIARQQQSEEDEAAARTWEARLESVRAGEDRSGWPLVVCDTDAMATSIWHERYIGHREPGVDRIADSRTYDLYLLTSDDIPFVQDGTRDGEHIRGWMTQRFRTELARRPEPWAELTGSRDRRLASAVALVDTVVSR